MNQEIKARKADIAKLLAATFPNYKGRTFKIEVITDPQRFAIHSNFWDGGSRSEWAACSIDGTPLGAAATWNPFRQTEAMTAVPLGFVVAEHVIFCGEDCGITFHVRAENIAALLPESV